MTQTLPKVLIVDDQPANLFALRHLLGKINVEVIEANNGNEALTCSLDHKLALILLDVQMPGMDGYEVASLLRSNEDTSSIPIIFVTAAYKDEAHRILGYDSGAVDYVEKPINDTILLSKMRVFIDLYESKQNLERILAIAKATNLQLTAEIAERKAAEAALKQAKLAAETANIAKSTFLANMSHELRTPLNAVLGYAQILQRDPALTALQQQGVLTIRRSGEYLLTLINDVLDLAKVEAGHLELSPKIFDINKFLELTDLFRIRAEEKNLIFKYNLTNELPAQVNADEKRLRQICMNLLSNAMKFTEQGEVKLETGYKDGSLFIKVADTGIGIPESMCKNIFDPFIQTGEDRYKQQGTGLGLAISRNLVEQMGGQIVLKSKEGIGSCFKIQIPMPIVDESLIAADKTQDDNINIIGYKRTDAVEAALKLLVVDDISENRGVIRGLLEPLGFLITEVSDGTEAVAITATEAFDLVFMDLVMEEMDGLTATRHIIARQNNSSTTPIIALTARAFDKDLDASLDAGCKDYLVKPFDISKLLSILQQYLPVEWLKTQPEPPFLTTEAALPLHETQRKELIALIQAGDINKLISYLEKLIVTPECPPQVKSLLELAKNFKLADMKHLLLSQ